MGAVLAAPVQAFGYIGVERPAFKLERDAGDYQIRDYPALLAAEVDATADNNGFRSLAGYIFGGNVSAETGSSQSIAMTAPVHTEITGDVIESNGTSGGMKMAFFLPSQYTSIEQLPRPKDDRVRLVQVPAKRYAVVTFNGSFVHNDPALTEKENQLRSRLKSDQVDIGSAHSVLWRYNPPWTLPWLRTNELAIPLP